MVYRKTEVDAVVALLMEPAADVTELAKAIINKVDGLREDRTDYVVGCQAGKLAYGFGLLATYNAAVKLIESGKIPAIDGTKFFVLPVRHQSQVDATWGKVDESPISEQAVKQWEIARAGGSTARSRSRRNRKRAA